MNKESYYYYYFLLRSGLVFNKGVNKYEILMICNNLALICMVDQLDSKLVDNGRKIR